MLVTHSLTYAQVYFIHFLLETQAFPLFTNTTFFLFALRSPQSFTLIDFILFL